MPKPTSPEPTRLRRVARFALRALGALLLLALAFGVVVIASGWEAFGTAPAGATLERVRASPQWEDGVFENPEPLWNDVWGSISEGASPSPHATPERPPETLRVDPALFETPPASGLRVTWLGHSTLIIEIDARRFLVDPVFGATPSPVPWLGPRRYYPPPLPLKEVPVPDAVLLSHDHYDHLDHPTIRHISQWDTTFVAPLGVGAHLAYWGVPEERIVELDWWESHAFGDLELVLTPARHASGRQVFDQNRTLWGGFALLGPTRRAYYSGDTGLFPAMRTIGERFGPFDLTMIEVGQYAQSWPDWHLGPEQAVLAHEYVRGRVLLPVHWGLFTLAPHGWTEPIERTRVASARRGVRIAMPRPGESVDPLGPLPDDQWWPERPWRRAEAYPIEATGVGE